MRYILILFIFAFISSSETLDKTQEDKKVDNFHNFQVLINETQHIIQKINRISSRVCPKYVPASSLVRNVGFLINTMKRLKEIYCTKLKGFLLDNKILITKAKSIKNNTKDSNTTNNDNNNFSDIIYNEVRDAYNDAKKHYEYCQKFLNYMSNKNNSKIFKLKLNLNLKN